MAQTAPPSDFLAKAVAQFETSNGRKPDKIRITPLVALLLFARGALDEDIVVDGIKVEIGLFKEGDVVPPGMDFARCLGVFLRLMPPNSLCMVTCGLK